MVYPVVQTQSCSDGLPMPAVVDSAGHMLHDALASAELYCPVEQFSHTIAPGPSLKVPGIQAVHADTASPDHPTLHRQWLALALAGAAVVECAGHSAHRALREFENLPVGHCSHVSIVFCTLMATVLSTKPWPETQATCQFCRGTIVELV